MAIYSTFFLCTPDELLAGFPGWKPPLEKPVAREVCNPFTGEPAGVVESFEPPWDGEDTKWVAPQYEVVSIEGDYQDYLNNRISPFLQSCVHWATKGFTPDELTALEEAMGIETTAPSPLYAPPSMSAFLLELVPPIVKILSQDNLPAVAKRWAANLSELREADCPAEDAIETMLKLKEMAAQAKEGDRFYLLFEY